VTLLAWMLAPAGIACRCALGQPPLAENEDSEEREFGEAIILSPCLSIHAHRVQILATGWTVTLSSYRYAVNPCSRVNLLDR